MNELLSISLERGEGIGSVNSFTANSWSEAEEWLADQAQTAPTGGCYDKTDFRATFEDGMVYDGRYDLKHISMGKPDLRRHIQEEVGFAAGLFRPRWMKDEAYERMMSSYAEDGYKEAALAFLRDYAVGLPIPDRSANPYPLTSEMEEGWDTGWADQEYEQSEGE